MGVIFDTIIYDLQKGGGVSVYYSEIIKRIIHDPDLFDSYFLCYGPNSKKSLGNIGVDNPCVFKTRFFERYRDIYLKKNMISGKVFHSSYYRLPANKKIPIITTVHDFTYEKYINGLPQKIHSWQKNRAIKYSDIIICVSENTARDLMEYCDVDESKIRVIYNGVSEIYRPLDGLDREKKVIFIGARGGYKNFSTAVDVIQLLPEFQLVIVGGGQLNKKEIGLLENKIPGRYKWLGYLSDEQLNTQYNTAFCLLYPSSYEGFGIPVIEAMRAGCPVIAIDGSSIPEVAGDAGVLIERPDVDLIAEAMHYIERNYQQLRLSGFSQSSRFSWDLCYNSTRNVYEELI